MTYNKINKPTSTLLDSTAARLNALSGAIDAITEGTEKANKAALESGNQKAINELFSYEVNKIRETLHPLILISKNLKLSADNSDGTPEEPNESSTLNAVILHSINGAIKYAKGVDEILSRHSITVQYDDVSDQ